MSFDGLKVIDLKIFSDERGSFVKPFHRDVFRDLGIETVFAEDFYSVSKKNVLRGLHFQTPPMDHSKLVYCTRGTVLDVALDLRWGSTSFGECFSMELSESAGKALFIPTGFAHGFLALTDDATVQYKVSTVHSPENDSGILWSSVSFDWTPWLKNSSTPLVSKRDAAFPKFQEFRSPFKMENLRQ